MAGTGAPSSLGSGNELPTGRWPDQLHFNVDPLYFTAGALQRIPNPLAHVVSIVFDEPVGVPPPYSFQIQLPVVRNLPNNARMYFFYVPFCHDGDELVFIPTPGSGDAVNQNILGHTFTLKGTRTLFVAICGNDNYLIHPLNDTIQSPAPIPYQPPPIWTYEYQGGGVTRPGVIVKEFATVVPGNFYSLLSDFNTLTGPIEIINGFANHVSIDTPLPGQPTVSSFLCNIEGWYRVTPSRVMSVKVNLALSRDDTVVDGRWYEFDNTGTYTKYQSMACAQFGYSFSVQTFAWFRNDNTIYSYMKAGYYYVFGQQLYVSSPHTLQYPEVVLEEAITFEYLGPGVAPLALRQAGKPVTTEPALGQLDLFARTQARPTRSSRVQLQKDLISKQNQTDMASQIMQERSRAQKQSSSEESGGVSLSVMENMIRQLIREQQRANESTVPNVFSSSRPLSTSSSSSSSTEVDGSSQQPSKKRPRSTTPGEKEAGKEKA